MIGFSYESPVFLMKTALLAPLLLLAATLSASAQYGTWTLLPTSPNAADNGRHEDISFPTPSRGYLVNFNGELHRTADGGESWQLLHSARTFTEEPVRFRSIGFASERRGWIGALTPGYILWQTDDSGVNLRNISNRMRSGSDLGICGLWVVNEDVVYGVGRYYGPARLYMTKNGGLTWTIKNMDDLAGRLIDVFFFDELHGFVVGGTAENAVDSRAVVLRTLDGGATWEKMYESQNPGEWGWKISFPTNSVGYVSVERFPIGAARVLKTGDGGNSWSESVIAGSRPLQGIGFVTKWQGWASGRGTTSHTLDGGLTWQAETSILDPVINRFRMFGDTLGYAVGSRVYKYVGKTQVAGESSDMPQTRELLGQNYPNPFYPLTTFEYEVLQAGHVEITVFDLLGRPVRTLLDRRQSPGAHRATWDGTDGNGRRVAPGFYLYTLQTRDHVETRRMVVLDTP
jgi:photosystem II stability/assembly factor-like uncharacterized protein